MHTSTLSVFPHVLIRIGGSSYDALEAMKQPELELILEELHHIEQERTLQKETLCDALLAFIRTLDNTQSQNQIQNLRRDLYNERKIKSGKLRKALQWMPGSLQTLVQAYLQKEQEDKQRNERWHQQYEQHRQSARKQLQQLSQEEALQKGLVLSSQSFLKKLPSYQQKSPQTFAKNDFRAEQSLLKYLTRIKAKTSPFSTFNNLCVGTVVPTASPIQLRASEQSQVVGHTRLNNQLFRYLKGLMTQYPAIYQHLLLRINPTITASGNQYTYLTNHHNVEAFQRLPQHPVIALILELCKAAPDGIVYQGLVKEITQDIEATPAAIEQYIRQLIDYGFLEFDFTVSGIDPNWDEQLVSVLQPLNESNVPYVREIIAALQDIRAWAEQYSDAEVSGRQQLLEQAYETFREVCLRLHEAAGLPEEERQTYEERLARYRQQQQTLQQAEIESFAVAESPPAPPEKRAFQHQEATMFAFKPEQLFYEDTTRQVAVTLGNQHLRQWITQIEKLVSALPLFRGNYEELLKMKHYFLEQYASDDTVSLLKFYEHYFRDVKKVESDQKAAQALPSEEKASTTDSSKMLSVSEEGLLSPPELEQQRGLIRQWNQVFAEHLKASGKLSQDTVHLTYEDIQAVNTALKISNAPATANSYGAFVQFYQENDRKGTAALKGVVNALFPGYGRMISRFLHILPYEVSEDVRSWNQQLEEESSLLIEDCDASYFNANLHPPLLPQEVRMPGGHNSLPASRQIPITDFVIRYDAEEDVLHLVHQPSGKRAYVLDLGFQGQQGRSPLFQLLEKFTKAEYRYTRPIEQVVNHVCSPPEQAQKSIRVYPRIMYEQQLVLQRKTWLVPFPQLPVRRAEQTDADYYFRINHWRQAQGMPADVFVTLNPNRKGGGRLPQKSVSKLGRDDYKPQYISFANPLLVALLEKLLVKEPEMLVFVEMYPREEQMLSINKQKYVTECVVQWYTNTDQNSKS
ncbi:MAG: lantibiotic dehydratase [Cyclobacteriaceae bacterium]